MPPNDMTPDAEIRSCLYQGHVMHMRMTPFAHKFRYRVFSLLLDIDRLEETISPLRMLTLDRFGLLAFFRRDHGARDGSDLRPWVEDQLSEAGRPKPARIWLLSFPRIFGYTFNPLSVYFCMDGEDRLDSIVYEVKNTFGDQHPYVVSAAPDPDGLARHDQAKGFFVSPFIGMEQQYRFSIRPPLERLAVKIRQHDSASGPDAPWLIATQNGERRPLTDGQLLRQWVLHPLMTIKVFSAIHWQALKLWWKGARFHRYRGPYPEPDDSSERNLLRTPANVTGVERANPF